MKLPIAIIADRPMPKVVGRGRKPRVGANFTLLNSLVPDGNPIFDVPKNKMKSIRTSAWRSGIKIKIRQLVDADNKPNGLYAIQRRK